MKSSIQRYLLGLPSHVRGRALQLRLDAGILYNLITKSESYIEHRRAMRWQQSDDFPEEPDVQEQYIANALGIPSLPDFQFQADVINTHLFQSVETILQETYDSFFSSEKTTSSSSSSSAVVKKSTAEYLQERFKFVPEIRTSDIPSAGRGLFVNGTASAAQVVAIYPGISYLPSQLRSSYPQSKYEALDLSDYMIARYDGVVIDGAAEIVLDIPSSSSSSSLSSSSSPSSSLDVNDFSHPFANAHLVNHPPLNGNGDRNSQQGGVANVLQFMIDIHAKKLPEHLRQLIPVEPCPMAVSRMDHYENMASRQRVFDCHHFVTDRTTRQVQLSSPPPSSSSEDGDGDGEQLPDQIVLDEHNLVYRTVVLVALRDLCNEEMFMNYRFNPKVEHPSWYKPCGDGFDASRRWFPRGAFY